MSRVLAGNIDSNFLLVYFATLKACIINLSYGTIGHGVKMLLCPRKAARLPEILGVISASGSLNVGMIRGRL